MIVITDAMADAIQQTRSGTWERIIPAALEAMTPEAKRELASQLLRSANTDEGHPDDTEGDPT